MDRIKALMICGVFAPQNAPELVRDARKSVEFSANRMQLKLIDGLKQITELHVLSAPFIGHYPNQSGRRIFRGFEQPQQLCEYVSFNNLWGYRNLSRARALKRRVRDYLRHTEGEKLIVVFSAHDPFLAAAAYAKKLDPRVRVCFVVPDLPQYMNLEENRGWLYERAKKYDIRSILAHCRAVDASVVLTAQMLPVLGLQDRPHIVAEGVIEDTAASEAKSPVPAEKRKMILYTGKLYRKFGIPALLEAFSRMSDPSLRLVLCGAGDAEPEARAAMERDPRILCTGQILPEEVSAYLDRADVLVNPRLNDEAYTKYSFPSKNLDYLLRGKPVVACLLDGMPEIYREFLYEILPGPAPAAAIRLALEQALRAPQEEVEARYRSFLAYAEAHLTASAIARKIVEISLRGQ